MRADATDFDRELAHARGRRLDAREVLRELANLPAQYVFGPAQHAPDLLTATGFRFAQGAQVALRERLDILFNIVAGQVAGQDGDASSLLPGPRKPQGNQRNRQEKKEIHRPMVHRP